jgi:hypothetical protein
MLSPTDARPWAHLPFNERSTVARSRPATSPALGQRVRHDAVDVGASPPSARGGRIQSRNALYGQVIVLLVTVEPSDLDVPVT